MRTIDVQTTQEHFIEFAVSVYKGAAPCLVSSDGKVIAVLLDAVDFFGMLETYIACRKMQEVGEIVN